MLVAFPLRGFAFLNGFGVFVGCPLLVMSDFVEPTLWVSSPDAPGEANLRWLGALIDYVLFGSVMCVV